MGWWGGRRLKSACSAFCVVPDDALLCLQGLDSLLSGGEAHDEGTMLPIEEGTATEKGDWEEDGVPAGSAQAA